MSENVNINDAQVVEEVKETVKKGIVFITIAKGEKPEEDKLSATLYFKEDDKFTPVTSFIELDLRKITDMAIDKFLDEGLTTDNIDVNYHHILVSELIGQEIRANLNSVVEGMKSVKAEYETMAGNDLIELNEDQKAMVNAGCKVIDKLVNKFSPKELEKA